MKRFYKVKIYSTKITNDSKEKKFLRESKSTFKELNEKLENWFESLGIELLMNRRRRTRKIYQKTKNKKYSFENDFDLFLILNEQYIIGIEFPLKTKSRKRKVRKACNYKD
jgi:hypothetical protein